MKNFQGIRNVLIGIFNPFYAFRENKNQINIPKYQHAITFTFVILLGLCSFIIFKNKAYVTVNINLISRVGFITGITLRILLTSYFLNLISSRITNTKIKFIKSNSIILVSTPILYFPFFFQWLNPNSLWIVSNLCLVWYLLIIGMGVWIKNDVNIFKALSIAWVSHLCYWFIGVTLFSWGMRL